MATITTGTPAPQVERIAHLLAPVWRDQRIGSAVAVGIAGLSGLLVALAIPRGPATAAQALLGMGFGLGVGLAAGLLMHTRWAMLLAPVAHVAVFEIGRLGTPGPTVGSVRFDTVYGILAFILGRGVYGLLVLLPMLLGAAYGAGLARRLDTRATTPPVPRRRVARSARRSIAGLTTLALIALAIWIALPASTPPILGADGKLVPGSIAELTTVRLGGHDQTIMIRGYSADKPVLLYLNGGPGQSGLPFTRVVLDNLSRDFVIVDWDQRGTGKSYSALEPTATLRLDQAINDTIELTNYLRQRFDEQKIYVVGESWGSILGVLAVQRQPDLFYAFIGSGQMVSVRETDRRFYQDVIDLAAHDGNAELAASMRAYGQPPYADTPYANFVAAGHYEKLYKPYTPSQAYMDRGNASGIGLYGVLASEYNLIEKVNVLRGLIDVFTVMYPQLQELDFRRDVPRLDVPVYILDGAAELTARRDLAHEWFTALDAPTKRMFTLENAAHSVAFEQFEAFGTIMRETVLPETYR